MNWLVTAIIVLPVVNWAAAVLLTKAAWHRPRVHALTERATTAITLAVVSTLFAALALFEVDEPTLRFVGAVAVALGSVPAIVWLARYLRGDFRA